MLTLQPLPSTSDLRVSQTVGIDWIRVRKVSYLQWHVHNGCDPSSRSSPGGGPETLPGGTAWFIHMNVAIHNARHHHVVAHIQHLQSQSGYIWQYDDHITWTVSNQCICHNYPTDNIVFHRLSLYIHFNSSRGSMLHWVQSEPAYLTANILRKLAVWQYLMDFPILYYDDSRTDFVANQYSPTLHSTHCFSELHVWFYWVLVSTINSLLHFRYDLGSSMA